MSIGILHHARDQKVISCTLLASLEHVCLGNALVFHQTNKVKLILSCMMEKVDLKRGEVITKEATFHSKKKST